MSQTQPPSFIPLPLPEWEPQRLRALAELEMLDTPPESVFNDLIWLASQLCEVPIAIVSLIDERRQWFKASCGLDVIETPRELAFCAYALLSPNLMEVPDALLDPRFAQNALVLGAPHIRFYAGMPLLGSGGYIYGTLCVIDTRPRQLSERQREGLQRLAKQVTAQLETRRDGRIAQTQAQTLSLLLETMPDAVVSCTADGTLGQFNRVARQWHSADPRALPPAQWPEHFNLFDADGERLLEMEQVPLVRAWRGESIRDVEMVIAAKGQQQRSVLCNAERLYAPDGDILGAVCVMRDVTAEREATRAALLAGQRFSGAFSAAAHGMALVSLEGRWLEVNDALCAMLGYSRAQLLDMDFRRITHPEDIARDAALLEELVAGERNDYHLDKRYLCRDGRTLWAHLAVSLVRDEHQRPVHFVSQIQDVTERQLAEQRLRHSESQLRTIADNAPALIAYVDRDLRFQFVNKPYADWFALLPAQIVGRHLHEVLDQVQFELLATHVSPALDGQPAQFDAELNDAAGQARIMHFSLVPDDALAPQRAGFHMMVSDITGQTRSARMMEARALHDELTGLPNRMAWNQALRQLLNQSGRRSDAHAALMFLDMNDFKGINDRYGHHVGDAVLVHFARLLKTCLREKDFIARLGGDEFVVLLDILDDPHREATAAAERVLAVAAEGCLVEGQRLPLQPSIGIALQTGPVFDPTLLTQRADEAMYAAKRDPNRRVQIATL
ncbi:diguanylate cyclase domain-containing protein [Xanthomonas albilineans]|uniref:diguanylate cyclase domain-containing protein n=1 Tax=Xanthomonas albilineans TaxID=29447 RepID=UPI0005F340AF|nr:diguanylate cyclase [Xanthomonas albilineans]PPU94654.1 sensor domain-containing diguanylate cyclase [Xanthomonas albilineans]